MKNLLIVLLVLINSACAAQDFVPITKGEPSPIDGYVISRATEKKLRQKVENLEIKTIRLEQLGVAKDGLIEAQKRHISVQKEHNLELREELTKSHGFWTKAAWFALGTLITGVISYGTVKTLR